MNSQFHIRHLLAAITILGVEIGLVRGALEARNPSSGLLISLAIWFAMTTFGIWLLGTWPWNKSGLPDRSLARAAPPSPPATIREGYVSHVANHPQLD